MVVKGKFQDSTIAGMVRPPDPRLLQFLEAYDSGTVALTLAVREMLLEEAPDCIESIYDAYSAVAVGYSFTGRLRDQFCHVATYAKHVNLGFNRGASLPDPRNVLIGKGSQIRHIKIASERDLAAPYLRTYIRAAIEQVGATTAAPGPKSIVKGDYPTKRRPVRKA